MARIIPLSGTENNRKITNAAGLLLSNEIHTTSQGRQFLKLKSGADVFAGPSIVHASVADEAAMLTLTSSTRGAWPGDWVLREDTGNYWQCVSNNGELLTDWREDGSISEDVLFGGEFSDMPSNILSGGTFLSRPTGRRFGGNFGNTYGGSF